MKHDSDDPSKQRTYEAAELFVDRCLRRREGAVALMDRETRSTGVGVGSLVRSRRRVHRKLPPDVGADVGLRLRARNDRVADSG